MTTKDMTCICCPLGCSLHVTVEDNGEITVTGNTCNRGAAYGKKEMVSPERTVTSTVRIEGKTDEVVSVKTAGDIPKAKITDVMKEIKGSKATLPVHIGDVIVKNVADTGVDVIATKDMM